LALSPDYAADRTIFAGTRSSGVFKSTNGGTSWSNMGLIERSAWDLALSPGYAADRTLFAGTSPELGYVGGVFKSTDGGTSWSTTGLTYTVNALALSPGYASDHTIFAGTNYGVFKSIDGGVSWSAVNTGLTGFGIDALALSPGYASDHTIFAGNYYSAVTHEGGIFKSTDGGASWSAVNSGFTFGQGVQALALSPGYASDHTIFAAAGWVIKSSDGGASWSATGLTYGVDVLVLSPGYVNDHTLFAGDWCSQGVLRSIDGGISWSAMNEGLGNLCIGSLALTPSSPRTLFAGTGGSSVWQYTFAP
jgi:photosystem II stability/assembly factor-like uncharacterized protein